MTDQPLTPDDLSRDLDADLKMIIASAYGFTDLSFIAAARTGWEIAIRRAKAAEAEVERLREENVNLREEVESMESINIGANKRRAEAESAFSIAIGTTHELVKEVERLREENDRLNNILNEISE